MKKHYKLTDNGLATEILGIKINQGKDSTSLSQELYVNKLLTNFGMTDCKPMESPMSTTFNEDESQDDHTIYGESYRYREAIGELLYLAGCTRPDIRYAVQRLSKAVENQKAGHWSGVKRILRYLKGTKTLGLRYQRSTNVKSHVLTAYCDASYATARNNKSVSGSLIYINGNIRPPPKIRA